MVTISEIVDLLVWYANAFNRRFSGVEMVLAFESFDMVTITITEGESVKYKVRCPTPRTLFLLGEFSESGIYIWDNEGRSMEVVACAGQDLAGEPKKLRTALEDLQQRHRIDAAHALFRYFSIGLGSEIEWDDKLAYSSEIATIRYRDGQPYLVLKSIIDRDRYVLVDKALRQLSSADIMVVHGWAQSVSHLSCAYVYKEMPPRVIWAVPSKDNDAPP